MWRSIVSVLPDPDFLHRLADIADAETLPRYRQPLDIETLGINVTGGAAPPKSATDRSTHQRDRLRDHP
jgi:hypothetical protein